MDVDLECVLRSFRNACQWTEAGGIITVNQKDLSLLLAEIDRLRALVPAPPADGLMPCVMCGTPGMFRHAADEPEPTDLYDEPASPPTGRDPYDRPKF